MAAAPGRLGGGASCLGVGHPGFGTVPSPTAHPRGVRPGPVTHWMWVRGVWALGLLTNPTARKLALRAVGAARGRLGGGVWGWALSHAPPPVVGVCGQGLLPTDFECE